MNSIRSGYSSVRLVETPKAIKFIIIVLYASLSPVILKIILFFLWLLDSISLSLSFSSTSSAPCSVISGL
jgi:hypothetical protein